MNFLDLNVVDQYAKRAVESRLFGSLTVSQAAILIINGAEMGIPHPIAAIRGISVVRDKIMISAGLMSALIKQSGRYDYTVIEATDKICRIQFSQLVTGNWKILGETKFDQDDAKAAGTQNMAKFPSDMLFARCLSRGLRRHCPDVLYGNVYVEGEIVENDGPTNASMVQIVTPEQQKTVQTEATSTVDNHVINMVQRRNLINNFVYAGLPDRSDKEAIKALIKAVFGVETTAQVLVADYESVMGKSGDAYERAKSWLDEHYPVGDDEGIDSDNVEAV